MTSIELKNVSKSIVGKKVVDDVSFRVEPGEFAVVLGPVGAGKTTLLRLIAGTISPDKGSIFFEDTNATTWPPRKRNIGMVFQIFAMYPNLNVYDNIAEPLRVKKLPKQEIDKKVREQASVLGLSEVLDHHPSEVSGGQAQRVVMARALVKDATAYLMDEPLTNLDYKLQESMRVELRGLLARKKVPIIYTTSDPREAASIADKLIVLHDGRVIQSGTVNDCYSKPASILAAKNYSKPSINLFDAGLTMKPDGAHISVPNTFEIDLPGFEATDGLDQCVVGIYPQDILLQSSGKRALLIDVNLDLLEFGGSDMIAIFRTAAGQTIQAYVPYSKQLPNHTTVFISIDRLHIFDKNTGALLYPK
jgi:ABC-type sugar transport system ATPase subunit